MRDKPPQNPGTGLGRSRQARAAILGLLLAPVAATAGAAVEGVEFPESLTAGGHRLELTGSGEYSKFLFRVYANALYLPPGTGPDQVLGDTPRCLLFHYFREITPEQFRKAAAPYLEKNLSPGRLNEIRDDLQRMNSLYRTVKNGDRYRLCYVPGEGATLALNGESLGSVGDARFADAYFRIWLGEETVSNELRDRMLPERTDGASRGRADP